MLGPVEITQDGGDPITPASTWNFSGITVAYDSTNGRLNFTPTGAGVPGGSTTELQYRSSATTFGAISTMLWNAASSRVRVASSGMEVRNPGDTFGYILAGSAIAANRTITLPLLTGDDSFVFAAFAQTLTNKTISGASNTLTVRLANDVTGILPIANGGTGHAGAAQAIAAYAIDWTLSNVFTKTLAAGANTFTFSNAASGMVISVRLTSDGGGSTVTWPTVKWAGGAPPTQTSTGTDVYTFVHDGTDIYGSVVQDMS